MHRYPGIANSIKANELESERNSYERNDSGRNISLSVIENDTDTFEEDRNSDERDNPAGVEPVDTCTAFMERTEETESFDDAIVAKNKASVPSKQDATADGSNSSTELIQSFDVGQYVRVTKMGHKKFGTSGVVQ